MTDTRSIPVFDFPTSWSHGPGLAGAQRPTNPRDPTPEDIVGIVRRLV